MSSACARVGATHIATSSPTWRTLSEASGGCSDGLKPRTPETARIGLTPARSATREDGVALRVGDLHAAHARMGERASHERHILHAGKVKIGDELAAPAHQAVVFLAEKARADALRFHRHSLLHGNRTAFATVGS